MIGLARDHCIVNIILYAIEKIPKMHKEYLFRAALKNQYIMKQSCCKQN